MHRQTSPWLYVPSLYLAEGLPYIMVNTVSAVMYKKMGMSNAFIGLTSILYLPWVVKMFWSPYVDIYGTRRSWILSTQLLMAVLFALMAACIPLPLFVSCSLVLFSAIAVASATHDISVDGYYMLALDKKRQAFFLGVRSLFYRLAVIFGSGLLVVLAGNIEKTAGNIPLGWSAAMGVPALFFAGAWIFHRLCLPRPPHDVPGAAHRTRSYRGAFQTYFRQPKIIAVTAFILLYRLGEAMLVKMAAPFLLDSPGAGGLGLATDTVGYVYGTVGVVSLAVGGLLGGWLVSRFSLRRCIWPMALMMNAPNAFYIYMAACRPPLSSVYAMVACEQFGYGLGFTVFSVFLMYIARPPFKTSHFAISTGLMALGMMLPGMASGILQGTLGYTGFFTAVLCLTLPGMLLIPCIPLDDH